jgi:choline dehydrogenase
MTADFDYIIVGSGAGGSTLAYRLASSGSNRVLVLEHGELDADPLHRIPLAHFVTEADDR